MKNKSASPWSGCPWSYVPRSSVLFEGNFGRLFRALSPAEFCDNDKSTFDRHSFLNQDPRWIPSINGKGFGVKEFVGYTLGI
jgi:hypothetical protein